VFSSKLGTLKGVKVKLQTKPDVAPQFFKAPTIPLVEAELERLEGLGIIIPVRHSEWAAPVVPVLKHDGTMGLCGDYRVTINKAAKVDAYPLPRVEDLLAALSGGKYFSKLDMSQVYLNWSLLTPTGAYFNILDLHLVYLLHQQFSRDALKIFFKGVKGCQFI